MFGTKAKKEASPTETALARLDYRLDQISSLYEPLAVRVANLEALARSVLPEQDQHRSEPVGKAVGGLPPDPSAARRPIGWLRILRHMWPGKVRRLLSEHDELEQIANGGSARSAHAGPRHAEPRRRIRARGEAIAPGDVPAFPATIFRADAATTITIIDVGAQDLVSEDHIYAPLQAAGATTIIGFEPLPAKDSAPRRADPSVRMLEHFVGAGKAATFHVTQFDPASSLLEPNIAFLSQFVDLPIMCTTVSSFEVGTTRLDDVSEITGCDYLKIDVQGGELDVLEGARNLLKSTIVVHCEVEFGPVYKDQPLFSDVDSFLRASGFELIDLVNAGYNRYKASPGVPATGSRLLWVEAIYFKSPDRMVEPNAATLLKAAYIAHVNYGMVDLAAHFLARYDEAAGGTTLATYLAVMSKRVGRLW